jgi:hypothetical protein
MEPVADPDNDFVMLSEIARVEAPIGFMGNMTMHAVTAPTPESPRKETDTTSPPRSPSIGNAATTPDRSSASATRSRWLN